LVVFGSLMLLAALALAVQEARIVSASTLLGFSALALLASSCGFGPPGLAYVSFDRAAQFAAVFVVGPEYAAVIAGVVAILDPWQRRRPGQSWRETLVLGWSNVGISIGVVFVGGAVFEALGGRIPLGPIDTDQALALLAAGVVVYVLNAVLLLGWHHEPGQRKVLRLFDPFATSVQVFAYLSGVLVAWLWTISSPLLLLLGLAVLSIAMLLIRQLGIMRLHLEDLVANRTRGLEEKAQALDYMSRTDSLTGLPNRRGADQVLEQARADALRLRTPLSVAVADLDRFKPINDEHSHLVGDRVLERIGELLAPANHKHMLAARRGGDEFIFCFPHTALEQAAKSCDHLRAALAEIPVADLGLKQPLSMSVGVAAFQGQSLEQLVADADEAMYQAKAAGRDQTIMAQTRPSEPQAYRPLSDD
jgi:diguanylate cyclase (GGDEF)-like protein